MSGDVRAVLFDAGNTLVFVDPGRMIEIFGESGVEVDRETFHGAEMAARLRLTRRLTELDAATGTEAHMWREYFQTLFRECGVPESVAPEVGERLRRVHAEGHLWTHVDDRTPEALRTLRDAGYRLGVISNADGRVPALLERLGLVEHLEFVVDSGEVGVEKPSRRIFDMAVERLDLPAGACLYVGDLYPVDVLGARGAGLRALLVDPWDAFADRDVDRVASVAEVPGYLERRG